jgi:type I restriction enzyme S subunit
MKTVKLADVCEIIAGQSPVGSSYNDRGDGMEFHQGKKLFGEMQLQSSRVFTSQPTKIAEPGDILMSVRAPVGPANFTDRQICIGRGLAAIRVGDEVDKEYLFHFLRLNESKINGKEGATFASINKSEIGEIELPLPSLAEQHRIVERLDGIFAQIDRASVLLEENIANTNVLKQSLLAQAFDSNSATHTHTD